MSKWPLSPHLLRSFLISECVRFNRPLIISKPSETIYSNYQRSGFLSAELQWEWEGVRSAAGNSFLLRLTSLLVGLVQGQGQALKLMRLMLWRAHFKHVTFLTRCFLQCLPQYLRRKPSKQVWADNNVPNWLGDWKCEWCGMSLGRRVQLCRISFRTGNGQMQLQAA